MKINLSFALCLVFQNNAVGPLPVNKITVNPTTVYSSPSLPPTEVPPSLDLDWSSVGLVSYLLLLPLCAIIIVSSISTLQHFSFFID